MALKQQHKIAEMVTNDTKMGWNLDSDKKKRKYISKYWWRHGFPALIHVQEKKRFWNSDYNPT